MSDLDRIKRAVEFAFAAHKGQTRKGTDTPYIVHPVGVALLVSNAGANVETMIAAVLHDVVEDCDVSLKTIEKMFGGAVADRVEVVTEVKDGRSWEQRKSDAISKVKDMRLGALLIKQADALYNITDCINDYDNARTFMSEKSIDYYIKLGTELGKRETNLSQRVINATKQLEVIHSSHD